MEAFLTLLVTALISLLFVRRYLHHLKEHEARARESVKRGKVHSEGSVAQLPRIDWLRRMAARLAQISARRMTHSRCSVERPLSSMAIGV